MNTITTEQKKKLYRAIAAAKHAGACEYISNNKPCCVIGQLAYIEGITVPEMKKWGAEGFQLVRYDYRQVVKPLLAYPYRLLDRIQGEWDYNNGNTIDEPERRSTMRAIVDTYCAKEAK